MTQLGEGLRQPVTVVTAPPGFGKTTLLQHWAQSQDGRETPLAWFSIGEDDDEPMRFLTYFTAALRAAVPDVGAEASELLHSPQNPSPKGVLTLLLNDLHEHSERVVLVLDDYHLITDTAVHDAMSFLLGNQPPNLHLVILTRADPPLPLARLRAQGKLHEVRASHLRFTVEDAETFLNDTMGLRLTREQVEALEQRTEGWIAGLQLAALSLQGETDATAFVEDFTGSHQYVLDYLMEEVMKRQTPERHDFLLSTSILQRLTGPLCDSVTARTNGDTTLEELASENLFTVPLDTSGTWFRYHHLFAEFLRHRLRRSSLDERDLRLRAADWCEREGLFNEALSYTIAADDHARAADLLERIVDPLWRQGGHRTMLDWLARLPRDVLAVHPRLALVYAHTELFHGHFDRVREHLAIARAGYREPSDTPQAALSAEAAAVEALVDMHNGVVSDPPRLERVTRELPAEHPLRSRLHFFLGLSHWMNGDVETALPTFRQVQEISVVLGDMYSYRIATAYVARVQASAGDWNAAVRTARDVLESREDWAISSARAGLGVLLLERNELTEASALLETDRQRAAITDDAWVMVGATATLARVRQAQDRQDEAAALMNDAVDLAHRHHLLWTWITTPLHTQHIQLLLQQDRLADAVAIAESVARDHPEGLRLPLLAESHAIAQARIALHRATKDGDRDTLVGTAATLETLRRDTERGGRIAHMLDVLVLLAITHHALGNLEEAVQALTEALEVSDPHGIVRPYLDERKPLEALLRQAMHVGTASPRLSGLADSFADAEAPGPDQAPTKGLGAGIGDTLSARELEVLELIAEGLTNKQIARRLGIALDTAKKHASNVLQKLEVSNRTQAVARARELQLL